MPKGLCISGKPSVNNYTPIPLLCNVLSSVGMKQDKTGKVAQSLRTHISLAEDPISVPSKHIGCLTTACNSRFRGM